MTMVCDILIDLELSIFKCSEKNIYIVEILIKIKDLTSTHIRRRVQKLYYIFR